MQKRRKSNVPRNWIKPNDKLVNLTKASKVPTQKAEQAFVKFDKKIKTKISLQCPGYPTEKVLDIFKKLKYPILAFSMPAKEVKESFKLSDIEYGQFVSVCNYMGFMNGNRNELIELRKSLSELPEDQLLEEMKKYLIAA